MTVTLTATNGTLTLSGTAELNFSCSGCEGDGLDDTVMTFEGQMGPINTALDGMIFSPTPEYLGAASVRIDTNDNGFTGDTPLSDNDTIGITITEVDDLPELDSSDIGNVVQGESYGFDQAYFETRFHDVEGNTINKFKVTELPTKGTLKFGSEVIVMNTEYEASRLEELKYEAVSPGSDSFKWNANDSEGANLYALSSATVTINNVQTNKAPTVHDISNKTGSEDSFLLFTLSDFVNAFTDPDAGNTLQFVKITTLPDPQKGTLELNSSPVVLNADIPAADLNKFRSYVF